MKVNRLRLRVEVTALAHRYLEAPCHPWKAKGRYGKHQRYRKDNCSEQGTANPMESKRVFRSAMKNLQMNEGG